MIETHFRGKLKVVGDGDLPVPGEMIYDESDPLAVTFLFHAAGDTVDWFFARELLALGCKEDTGAQKGSVTGDVRIWPSTADYDETPVIYVSLNSPEGEALIEINRNIVEAFLWKTYDLVPIGSENYNMSDESLYAWLSE